MHSERIGNTRIASEGPSRFYVSNMLKIVRTGIEPGAGTTLLVGIDFAGCFTQHLLWGILTAGRHNIMFAVGMASELARRLRGLARRMLCGY